MKWTAHIEGGPRRVNHAAVCIGDKILSFGGYCSTEEYTDGDPIPVHVLNTETLRWSAVNYKKTGVVPFQRYGHTTVAYKGKVYMWGGRNNIMPCDILTVFNARKLEWNMPSVSGMVPYAKDGHSACVIKNKMYIFGGFEYFTDQYSQEVHCLDLDTLEWKFVDAKGTPPSHRDFHTAVAYGDKMFVFGGRGDLNSPYNSQEEIYCSQMYYLDTKKETWVALNPNQTWPEGRRSHSAWIHDDYMYIFGGYNGNTKIHFNDLFRYSIKNNYWELVHVNGLVPCKRRRQACIILKDKMYLFGGTRSDSEFESIVAVSNKQQKAGQKRKPHAASARSDSELEWGETTAKPKVKKPVQKKSKRTTTAASKKKETCNPFELFPEDESLAKNYSAPDELGSSITQRVGDGITRRAVDLEGAFFLELRVYNTDDIRSELAVEKWKKVLLSVKAQIDIDTPQWEYLQKLTKHLKTLFDDADVKYFQNKKV